MMGNDNCFGTEDPTLQYIESATSRPDLFNPGDQTTEMTQYPDPTTVGFTLLTSARTNQDALSMLLSYCSNVWPYVVREDISTVTWALTSSDLFTWTYSDLKYYRCAAYSVMLVPVVVYTGILLLRSTCIRVRPDETSWQHLSVIPTLLLGEVSKTSWGEVSLSNASLLAKQWVPLVNGTLCVRVILDQHYGWPYFEIAAERSSFVSLS